MVYFWMPRVEVSQALGWAAPVVFEVKQFGDEWVGCHWGEWPFWVILASHLASWRSGQSDEARFQTEAHHRCRNICHTRTWNRSIFYYMAHRSIHKMAHSDWLVTGPYFRVRTGEMDCSEYFMQKVVVEHVALWVCYFDWIWWELQEYTMEIHGVASIPQNHCKIHRRSVVKPGISLLVARQRRCDLPLDIFLEYGKLAWKQLMERKSEFRSPNVQPDT